MRSIARQSVRLASSSRTRQPSRPPRLPQQQHVRSISHTVPLRVDARSPSGTPDNSTPVEPQHGEEEAKERERRIAAQENGVAGDRSTEVRKTGKTYKQRLKEKAQRHEPPNPPPIPDWFLRHNVKLQTETVAPNRSAKNAQVLRCIDKDTGHTLFVLPYYEAWPVPGLPGRPNDESKSRKDAASKKKTPLEQTFFDNKFEPPQSKTVSSTTSDHSSIQPPPSTEAYSDINPHTLLRWPLLEAETSIRAGFAMATQGPQSHLYASSRVDLSLHCADDEAHDEMDELVEDLANLTGADIIRLDSNDFEDLLIDYVESGSDAPGTFSRLAYDVFKGATATRSGRPAEEEEDDDAEEEEEDEEDASAMNASSGRPGLMGEFGSALFNHRSDLTKALGQIRITGTPLIFATKDIRSGTTSQTTSGYPSDPFRWDEARLKLLLDHLLDATREKKLRASSSTSTDFRSRSLQTSGERSGRLATTPSDLSHQALWRVWRASPGCWFPDIAGVLAGRVKEAVEKSSTPLPLRLETGGCNTDELPNSTAPERTIVHVRDVKDISRTEHGQAILRNLIRNVRKRRKAGQEIIIVGTTAQDEDEALFAGTTSSDPLQELRRLNIPAYFNMSKEEQNRLDAEHFAVDTSGNGSYRRILEINLRHLSSMLERMRPAEGLDLFSEGSQAQLKLAGSNALSQKVLTFDLVQRIVLCAVGLLETHAKAGTMSASHIALAIHTTVMADQAASVWSNSKIQQSSSTDSNASPKAGKSGQDSKAGSEKSQARLDKLKKTCNQHEQRLLAGVVDPQNIKTGFKEVHAPPETIDALKSMTSLSLLRPDAFKYGVLAADRLPGLMLYGPPGTGKTLLAKAVAKDTKATMLEVSGAQIYEKYVGEGEKMVRAVFSLAKKLSPCIVFIDEADAIFGSRSSAGNRNTHREIINQFLREWDGMDLHNVFIMVASNRPFDMDDAVLRRLPRRLLVDLPVAKDRESILKIHLKDETLDSTVNLAELAEQTPLYSGSDLKNLCVAAALACVREENELAESKSGEKEFKLPEKRTLSARHFDKAVREISASISEDMSSLTAIKKFDEQFGDRKGRRKKAAYGFGMGDAGVNESAARVRDTTTTPPPP